MEARRKIAKALSLAVGIAGVTVIAGWILDISLLKSISPAWISMKFNTAVAFAWSGIILYFIAQARKGEADEAQVVLPIAALVILLLMGTLLFAAIFGVHTGLEELFVQDMSSNPTMVIPGRPSLPTMFNFVWIVSAAVLTVLNIEKLTPMLKITGLVVLTVGSVAVTGYLAGVPLLYYFIQGVNSAMACHTAILFMLLGAGFLCL